MKVISFSILTFLQICVFSQKKNEMSITGVVYMNSSRSQGIMNGKTFTDPQHTFRNQTIYFKRDSTFVNSTTDSAGGYTITLAPGSYEVFQSEGLKNTKNNLAQFGTCHILIKKDGGPYDIFFRNHTNGRSTAGGTLPDGRINKTNSKKSEKKE